ncbi:MAG: pentapeptide repeat-containing protein [Candidatus Parcubacteria bacterium]|nr:pentapeptide repeat-containing protein [Candidatus Parcubacteria bacterium]
MTGKKEITAAEVKEEIKKGLRNFNGATIKGNLYLGGATIEGDLDFRGATIKGDLNFGRAPIEGNLYLGGATIEGNLYLGGATIEGELDFSTKEGPTKIYVSPEMAERVHFAAPNIPLVMETKPR